MYEERIYIFGGVSNDGAQSDLHVLSLGHLNDAAGNFPRVGSFNDHDSHPSSPMVYFIFPLFHFSLFINVYDQGLHELGTSPLELNFLQRSKASSSLGADRELLTLHNKDEGPLIVCRYFFPFFLFFIVRVLIHKGFVS